MNRIVSLSAIVAAGLIGVSSLTYAQGAGGGGGSGSTMGSEASNGQGGTTAKDKKMGATGSHSGMDHGSMSKSNGSMSQRSQSSDTISTTQSEPPAKNKRMDMTKGQGGTSGTPGSATSNTGVMGNK